jgi:TctA family transporter
MRILEKITIFVLYMIGDTLLAVLLVLGYPVYSPPLVQFSPFTTGQFYGVAYVMFLIMNSVLFGVIGYVFKKLLS